MNTNDVGHVFLSKLANTGFYGHGSDNTIRYFNTYPMDDYICLYYC